VVLHLEPQVGARRLESNTARTVLLLDHEPLPWSRWGEEFAASMPEEIRRLQESAAGADCLPRQEAIRSRVTAILPLCRLSRYRPTRPGGQPPAEPATAHPGSESTRSPSGPAPPSAEPAAYPTRKSVQREPEHSLAGCGSPAHDPDHDAHSPTIVGLPDVAWISARDATRAPGDLDDQAARYTPTGTS
jgi:hypothetical protein